MTRSFEIGDQIAVGETEGTVEEIEVRLHTLVLTTAGFVLVPNAEVFGSPRGQQHRLAAATRINYHPARLSAGRDAGHAGD